MTYTHIIPQNLDHDIGGTILARAATTKEIRDWFLSDPYYLEIKVSRDCKKITCACSGPSAKKWRVLNYSDVSIWMREDGQIAQCLNRAVKAL